MSTNPGKITFFNTDGDSEKKFFPLYEIKPNGTVVASPRKKS
jgi:hypothetical protein